jgi:trimeric autotransporter adhesin
MAAIPIRIIAAHNVRRGPESDSIMKETTLFLVSFSLALTAVFCAPGQGTAFTYQGRLNDGGTPATGTYDFTFTVWDAPTVGSPVSITILTNGVGVSNGLFSVLLDFGNEVFTGPERWLQIALATNASGAFRSLSPRQQLTATPYAITAGNLTGAVPSGGLAGMYSNTVTFNNNANSFTGNGSGLSNVDAATLGGLASSNVWRLGGNAGNPDTTLGSIDPQPLKIIAGNRRVLQAQTVTRSAGFLNTQIAPNIVGGSQANTISSGVLGATIAGGGMIIESIGPPTAYPNTVSEDFGTIGGGFNNTVGNGDSNFGDARAATIGGGATNRVESPHGTIGGGSQNRILGSSPDSVIGGGFNNVISNSAMWSTIGGGLYNQIHFGSWGAGVLSGNANEIHAGSEKSVIAGGSVNWILSDSDWATIGGGIGNRVGEFYATVAGGTGNQCMGISATVAGGSRNTSSGPISTVGGGFENIASGRAAVAAGGDQNTSAAGYSSIGGGQLNIIADTATNGTIAGGVHNLISSHSPNSTIAGGTNNIAVGLAITIGGGEQNYCRGDRSVVAGGSGNAATGSSATVPGGLDNTAAGGLSFAAGYKAKPYMTAVLYGPITNLPNSPRRRTTSSAYARLAA